MARFHLELWDRNGFRCQRVLDNATNIRVRNEINGERTLSFELPLNDPKHTYFDYRKIIRIVDNSIVTHPTKIIQASPTGKDISVLSGDNYNLGDFLQVFETVHNSISQRLASGVTAGDDVSITVGSTTGMSNGDYLYIEDDTNAEVFMIKVVQTADSFTADLAYSYSAGAGINSPGRSFVGKITSARKASTTTLNAEAASGSAVVVEVASTAGIAVNDYVWIDDGIGSEAQLVTAISAGVSITVAYLTNSYLAGAVVTDYSFTLSRRDFVPAANALVKQVNFTTYRIAPFTEKRASGITTVEINCEHITYDLNEQYFLLDGRGDISYSIRGSGAIQTDRVDINSLLDDLLLRQVDSNNNPLDTNKFFKGDLYSFRYSTGTISVTYNNALISGSGTEWFTDNVSSGSILSIEGDSTIYIVSYVSNNTALTIIPPVGFTGVKRETGSGLKYLLISPGFQTYSPDKIGTCSVKQNPDASKITAISVDVSDGNVHAGALFNVKNDAKDYYVRKVDLGNSLYLTEDVERAGGINLDLIIRKDEREITFSSATKLLGALNEITKIWTDDRQAIWYEIDEDRSINIRRKPLPDDRDPTSDLVIRCSYNLTKNLQAIRRIYDSTEFGNRVLAQGASSEWVNAFSNISTVVIADADNTRNMFKITAGDAKKFRPGDPIQIFHEKVSISGITSATQITLTKSSATWTTDQFRGGLVIITSSPGSGQIRAIVSNTATTITVSRAWDTLPIGANAVVAKDIGNTYIRGFGYKRFVVDSASPTRVDIFDEALTEYAYRGGILNILLGTGRGQSYEIYDNQISDYDGDTSFDDSRIRINGTFDPSPVANTSTVEIVAPAQMVEEYRSGTTFTANTVAVVPGDHNLPNWRTDMWTGGTLYITSGDDENNTYSILDTAWSAGTGTITISGTFSTTPSAGDGILLVEETDLQLAVAAGLRFTPSENDEIVLLLKETGGALSVGKYADYRSTVVKATQTSVTVQSGDGAKFSLHQGVFIGAKTITSVLLFNMLRGNQTLGQVATIASKSGDRLIFNEILNPTPQPGDHVEILSLVDTGSIRKHGLVELTYPASDINDPKILYRNADKFLKDSVTSLPKYEVEFEHLYELDPETWRFDNYEIGDSIRVIDDELSIDRSDLRIISEEYDPNIPANVTVQIAELTRSQIRTQSEIVNAKLDVLEATGDQGERAASAPACVYWDDELKLCGRNNPPNVFCNSNESNYDGKMTREKIKITKLYCQAFTPTADDLTLGTQEGAIVTARDFAIDNVDNDAWDSTHYVPYSFFEYEAVPNSFAFITGVWDASTGSKLQEDDAEVRVVPVEGFTATTSLSGEYLPRYEGDWRGCYVQAKRASGTTATVNVRGAVIIVGKRP